MTLAPAEHASWRANVETPPPPCTSTVSPGLIDGRLEQRVPGCDACTWERRSLFERIACRNLHPGAFGQHDFFGEHAIERSPEGAGVVLFRKRAVDPRGKERRGDSIAGREALYAAADFDHFAGAVGCWNDPPCPLLRSASDHQVAIVQRYRSHADAHVSGTDIRPGTVNELQRVEAVFRMELECFHGAIVSSGRFTARDRYRDRS